MTKYVTIHSNDRMTPMTTVTVLLSVATDTAGQK
jgi:hypothetical protein